VSPSALFPILSSPPTCQYKGKGWMEGNAKDKTQRKMQKAWGIREKIWQSSLSSCYISPNDPPRAFFV
jgi:hypothetical protein